MDQRVKAVLAALENHGDLPSVESLASALNLSVPRLRHLFKRETGTPIGNAMRALRMAHAQRLLDGSSLSVKQITYELGLTDETYFIREFKKTWGTTPVLYRQRSHPMGGGAAR